jgi:hypothetical protein
VSEGGTVPLDTGTQTDATEDRSILDAVTEETEAPLCPQGEASCGAVESCLASLVETSWSVPPEDGGPPDGVFVFDREQDVFDYIRIVAQVDASSFPLAGQTFVGANGHQYVYGYLPWRNMWFVVDGSYAPAAYQLGVQYEQCIAQDAAAD